jgi:uncharacterized coiled-coil DUF342 family protein
MAEQEQVSQERFEDFKSQVLTAISDVKDSLSGRISELTGEIKAYSQVIQIQSNQLTKHDTEIDILQKISDKHEDKLEKQGLNIKELQTTMENNQKNTNRNLTIISVVFAAITLILKLLNWG